LDFKRFAIHLERNRGQSIGGVATFGDYNQTIVGNKTICYNDLVSNHYWTVNLISAFLNDKQIPISTNHAIVDTGTSYLLMPKGTIR
jgi:Eukaryotic aspartyl protease